MKSDSYVVICRHCNTERTVSNGSRALHGKEATLMVNNDCLCPPMSASCDQCSEHGRHWLGCPVIGLPTDESTT